MHSLVGRFDFVHSTNIFTDKEHSTKFIALTSTLSNENPLPLVACFSFVGPKRTGGRERESEIKRVDYFSNPSTLVLRMRTYHAHVCVCVYINVCRWFTRV